MKWLLVVSLCFVLFFDVPSAQGAPALQCNQSATGPVEKTFETKTTSASPSANEKLLSGRLLSRKPLFVELKGNPFDFVSNIEKLKILPVLNGYTRIPYGIFLGEGDTEQLMKLKFGDPIEFSFKQFVLGGPGELGCGLALVGLKKGVANLKHTLVVGYHPSGASSNAMLLIYEDGKVFYHDDMNYVLHTDLKPVEMAALFKDFNDCSFDKIPSNLTLYPTRPSLMLLCKRVQIVDINKHRQQVSPVVRRLETLRKRILEASKKRLGYAKRYELLDWPYGSIAPLGDHSTDALDKRKNALKDQNVPKELIDQLKKGAVYKWNGKLYTITFGSWDGDHPGPEMPLKWDGLWELETDSRYVKQFPGDLGIQLANVPAGGINRGPAGGIDLQPSTYSQHRSFFDALPNWPGAGGVDPYWQEGKFLYRGLHVQLDNVDGQWK